MADTSVRTDTVDVEQIMQQLRTRIRERRGADYTDTELHQLASAKLEQLLDARGVGGGRVSRFLHQRAPSPDPPTYEFEDSTLFATHRGLLRGLRRALRPILKLFINPDPLSRALHIQVQVNAEYQRRFRQRDELDQMLVDVIRSLVVENTRIGLDVQSLKMRLESISTRMDFDERRARSREVPGAAAPSRPAAVNQPPAGESHPQAVGPSPMDRPAGAEAPAPGGRRRRRRRRRRSQTGEGARPWGAQSQESTPGSSEAPREPDDSAADLVDDSSPDDDAGRDPAEP